MFKMSFMRTTILAFLAVQLVFSNGQGEFYMVENTTVHRETYTSCGGELRLSTSEDIFIEYKYGETLYSKEQCIWILRPEVEGPTYTVRVTMIANGFRDDGIAVYTVDPERNNLSSYMIQRVGEGYDIFLNPLTFLNFFAGTSYPYSATGFIAQVELFENHVNETPLIALPKFSIHHLLSWHDYFRYPLNIDEEYGLSERVYVLIQPFYTYQAYFRVNLDFMDIQNCTVSCGCDFLDVRRLDKISGYSAANKLCGVSEIGTEHIVASRLSYPVLLIFNSDNSTAARGFQVTWEQSDA